MQNTNAQHTNADHRRNFGGDACRLGLIEDDPAQAEVMRLWLEQAGYEVSLFATGQSFLDAAQPGRFDVLIVDWMLPDIGGDRILEWVRERLGWDVGVLFATARRDEQDVAYILNLGADDFIGKPIGRAELIARVDALQRRLARNKKKEAARNLTAGTFRLDPSCNTVYAGETLIQLTKREFDLATVLFSHRGELVTREYLLRNVWGHKGVADTRTVDVHISRLKKKLRLEAGTGWAITSIHRLGYRFEPAGD